jgi:uncharacterized protein (DUF362 family)
MPHRRTTRRQFLLGAGAGVIALATRCQRGVGLNQKPADQTARVVIARDDALTHGQLDDQVGLMMRMLGAAMQRITGQTTPAAAWASLFSPKDIIGIKVNCLGLPTSPAVVQAVAACLRAASVPAEQIIVWDRFDVELAAAGYKLNRSTSGLRCYGTDATTYGSGYEDQVETSGQIGSCFSRVVAQTCTALISVPVLKDHNLAGVSLSLKNFFGAIHNPNKYHDNNCDPYVADVVAHRYIRSKLRLAVCDATRAQYNAGPARHPGFAWHFGGLIVSRDPVAADRVGLDLLETERRTRGLESLEGEKRPATHIMTAASRGLGTCQLDQIERTEL